MKDYQVVVVGDAIIDIFVMPQKEGADIHIDQVKEEVRFRLGAKIPVDNMLVSIGGNATNVSCGLSKLAIRTTLMAEIGDDNFAQVISKELSEKKVSQEYLIRTKGAVSTISVIISTGEDRTIFAHHIQRKHDFDFSRLSTEWMYLTSLGEVWHEAYERAFTYVQRYGVKLAFNPGSHQLAEGEKSFKDMLPHTQILFVNREEAEMIAYGQEWNGDGERKSLDTLLPDVQKLGPVIVSITDSVHGSYAIDRDGKTYHQDTVPSLIVEKTGVGDAYATGFLGAIINGESVPVAMKWGAASSASVIEHVGATNGLMTKEELLKRIM